MVAVVAPSSGGSVLANSSSVCQFLVTEVRRATMNFVKHVPLCSGRFFIYEFYWCFNSKTL